MKESYNSPEGVYRRAKARGMDLVTITDHDDIAGAMTIADRPDVIIEIINGSRLPTQNQTAACLADACGKVGVAGSDSHTRRADVKIAGRSEFAMTCRYESINGQMVTP
jgi:predicted metal-dependent phosphoesterase TrpH